MIFWDELAAGKPKAYAIDGPSGLRFPSSIACVGEDLLFGQSPQMSGLPSDAVWYESIKMRVAAESSPDHKRFCYGGTPQPPAELTFADLAVLAIWQLRSIATYYIGRKLSAGKSEFAVSVTVGIPRSFYEFGSLRCQFLKIARAAEILHKQGQFTEPSLPLKTAKEAIRFAKGVLAADAIDDRFWLRSEAEADMFWPVRCPGVPPGPYAQVDIGAGTTNAAVVSIWERNFTKRWIKDSLGFYGAQSVETGTDAIDASLAQMLGIPADRCLSLRGHERAHVNRAASGKLLPVFRDIREAYDLAWRRATACLNQAERQTFPDHLIFITGGGSLIPGLAEELCREPSRPHFHRRVRQLERPDDLYSLDDKPVSHEDMPFLSAAYGLSFHPDEVPPTYQSTKQPSPRERYIGLGVIYDK
jgi:hypothetical protein